MNLLGSTATLVALLAFVSMPAQAREAPRLCIRYHDTGEVLLRIPVDFDQTFTIRYIHSVDHTPVFEVFRADKGTGIVLEETYFMMFGAGMGHWQGHGRLVQDGKWIKIRDIHRPLGKFLLRVGSPGVDHTILLKGNEWNLSLMAPGRRVEVMLLEDSGHVIGRANDGKNERFPREIVK